MSKLPVQPGAGMEPPPNAPREITQPMTDQAVAAALAMAQANEKELAPLVFQPGPLVAPPPATAIIADAPSVSGVDALSTGGRRLRQVSRRPSVEEGEAAAPGGPHPKGTILDAQGKPVPTSVEYSKGAVDLPKDHQPAGVPFGVESPARGVPRPIADAGKQITGGFGEATAAQYMPLDGTELRELCYALMDRLHKRLADDLRFSIAVCYPRVTARVVVEIQATAAIDQSFDVPTVPVTHDKTPMDVARQYGDEVVFVVVAERVEMSEDGTSLAPPNQTRIDLGLPVPRKQSVDTPTGKMMVDVLT